MPDEQAQVEETNQVVEESTTEETTSDDQSNGSEAAQTQTDEDGVGDLRIPLREERSKRQQYEKLLQDREFIYEQAKKLGLTEDGESSSNAAEAPQQYNNQNFSAADVSNIVSIQLDHERVIDKQPEFKSDPALRTWYASLLDGGHRPKEAASIINKTLNSRATTAKTEGALAEKNAISEKERASTITNTSTVNAEAEEIQNLRQQARNWKDPKAQERAMLKLLQKK